MPFDRRNIPLGADVKQEISGAKNIFEVFYSMSRETPPGAYPLNTGEWIRGCKTLYPEFYAKAQEYQPKGYIRVVSESAYNAELAATGQCGAFVISGNDIRLPKITRYIRGYESEQANNVHNNVYLSGLPNITGFAATGEHYNSADASKYGGAFYIDPNERNKKGRSGTDSDNSYLYFDASRSNGVYGNYTSNAFGFSNEVVVPCVTMALYIQVFNRVPITGYVQIKDVLELVTNYTREMEQKYNEAIDAVNSILSGGSLGIPDYANYVVVSGSSYTAPSDGWIYNRWVRGGTGATLILTTYIYADSSKSRLLFTYTNSDGRRPDKDSGTTDITNFLPVRKGYYIEWTTVNKTNGTLTNYFYPTFGQ